MKLVLFGDSHVRAIGSRMAIDSVKSTLRPFSSIMAAQGLRFREALTPFHRIEGRAITFNNPETRTAFEWVSGTSSIESGADYVLALSMPFTTNLFARSSCWKRWTPWDQAGARGASPVSSSVFESMVLSHFAAILSFFDDLKRLRIKVVALEAPPIRLTPDITDRARLVQVVDQRARAIVARHFQQSGVPVVRTPKQAYGANGFLCPDLQSSDPADDVHADARLGVLMMPSIKAAAELLLPVQGSVLVE